MQSVRTAHGNKFVYMPHDIAGPVSLVSVPGIVRK